MKKLMYVFVCLLLCFTAGAQELNARVTINSDKVQGTNKQASRESRDKLASLL